MADALESESVLSKLLGRGVLKRKKCDREEDCFSYSSYPDYIDSYE